MLRRCAQRTWSDTRPRRSSSRRQLDGTGQTLATAGPAIPAEVLSRVVEVPDLGTLTIEEWGPLILGHAIGHVEQAFEIMRNREFLPQGI